MEQTTSLKLQQVVCPSCGRPINSFNPNKLMTECPYCGSHLVNPLISSKEIPVPERIIPFTTNEQSFETALVNSLVNQDYVPVDIFQSIKTDKVFQAYLPMYLYEGTFNSAWSCESSYMDQKVSVSSNSVSTRDVKKWRPQNGNAAGNFAFLCLANEGGKEIPDELREFTKNFPYDVMMSKEFNESLIDYNDDNLLSLERNTDASLIWQKYGMGKVDETAKKAAHQQIGNQEIRNFRASSSFNLTTTGKYVLAPFWFVYYTYNGTQYHFLMDGVGQTTSYSYPVNQDEVKWVNGKVTINNIVKWLWPLAILVWVLSKSFVAGLIFFGVWFVAKLIVKKVMENQIANKLDASRREREAAAAAL